MKTVVPMNKVIFLHKKFAYFVTKAAKNKRTKRQFIQINVGNDQTVNK